MGVPSGNREWTELSEDLSLNLSFATQVLGKELDLKVLVCLTETAINSISPTPTLSPRLLEGSKINYVRKLSDKHCLPGQ